MAKYSKTKSDEDDEIDAEDRNKESSHRDLKENSTHVGLHENIELLSERRDKLSGLAASCTSLADKTQQYKNSMAAINKGLEKKYRLSNHRMTLAIVILTTLVIIAVVIAIVIFSTR